MVLQCSNLYITKTLDFGMPLQPRPLSACHCGETEIWDPPEKDSPLFTLDLTHFVSGKQLLGAGDVSLASLLFGSIVSAKSWAVRGTSRYQLLIDKGLGDILPC